MRDWFRHVHRIAIEDRNLSFFLLVLAAVVFVVFPLAEDGTIPRAALQGFVTLLLLSGVLVMSAQPRTTLIAAAFAGVVIVARWAAHLRPHGALGQVDAPLALAFFFWLTTVVLSRVVSDGPISKHRIYGAIAVY